MSLSAQSSRKVIHLPAKVDRLPLLLIRTGALIHRLLVGLTHVENTTRSFAIVGALTSSPSIDSVVTRVIH